MWNSLRYRLTLSIVSGRSSGWMETDRNHRETLGASGGRSSVGSRVPHEMQNRWSVGWPSPQRGQYMAPPSGRGWGDSSPVVSSEDAEPEVAIPRSAWQD